MQVKTFDRHEEFWQWARGAVLAWTGYLALVRVVFKIISLVFFFIEITYSLAQSTTVLDVSFSSPFSFYCVFSTKF